MIFRGDFIRIAGGALLCALLAAGAPAMAQQAGQQPKPQAQQQPKIDPADAAAMKKLAKANLAEIKGGRLADTRALSEPVKEFGQRMVEDHGRLEKELEQLAQQKGVKLPEEPAQKKEKKAKKAAAMPREKFDEKYMQQMVKAHEKAVKETEEMARTAKDPDWKALAQKGNDVIRQHLRLAQQIAEKQGAAAGGSKRPSGRQ